MVRGSVRGAVHQVRVSGFKPLQTPNSELETPTEPPCLAACPLHQEVPAYVAAIARGDPAAAIATIRRTNPLPSVCGAVCNRSCERACVRGPLDGPVAIRALKSFAAADESRRRGGNVPAPVVPRASGPLDVAIVGAGPAGLSAAHDLAAAGYGVTIYEARSSPGGMLAWAVPPFVMPRALLEADIEFIRRAGVEIRTGVRVGGTGNVTLDALCKVHRAVLLALGAPCGSRLGIPGEAGFAGATDHVSFAVAAASPPRPRLDGPCVVVGGSGAAFQAARIAVRLGCSPVTVAYWRSAEALPADPEGIADAVAEGVRVEHSIRPLDVTLLADGGAEIRFRRVRDGEEDAWGYRPVVDAAAHGPVLSVRTLVATVGRSADLLAVAGDLATTPFGFVTVDPATGMTSRRGLFAAGDVVSGPKTVVEAIAGGRRAASAIRRFLEGVELRPGVRRSAGGGRSSTSTSTSTSTNGGKSIVLRIDGREVEAKEHEPLLAVARREGFDIPAMCRHERLSPYGACRLCLVEARRGGRSRITTSCNYPAIDGLDVLTASEPVLRARRRVVGLMLGRAPRAAPLAALAASLGVDSTPSGTNDGDCILCGLCVRACEEAVGACAIVFSGRGADRKVESPFGNGPSPSCISCGACAAVCPVGAHRTLGRAIRRLRHDGRSDHPCRYALMGLVSDALCANVYECGRCDVEHAARDLRPDHPLLGAWREP